MGQKTYPALPTAAPKALVFWCGDPRIQEAVNHFLHDELGLQYGEYVPITVLGGIASFSEQLSLPKDFKYMKETAEFCLEHFGSLKQIILINHEDCAKYKALRERIGPLFRGFRNLPERQIGDLLAVERILVSLSHHPIGIERYYGRYADSERTQFVFDKH